MLVSRPLLRMTALAFGVLFAAPAIATSALPMLGFGQDLNPTDKDLLRKAVRAAVAQGQVGATSDWSDQKTGRAGRATVLRMYQQGNAPCSSVEHVFTQGGGGRYVIPLCRQPDGTWKMAF